MDRKEKDGLIKYLKSLSDDELYRQCWQSILLCRHTEDIEYNEYLQFSQNSSVNEFKRRGKEEVILEIVTEMNKLFKKVIRSHSEIMEQAENED